VTDVIH
jgi:hypothetical protein